MIEPIHRMEIKWPAFLRRGSCRQLGGSFITANDATVLSAGFLESVQSLIQQGVLHVTMVNICKADRLRSAEFSELLAQVHLVSC